MVENQYSSILQKNKNKLMHAMNGNRYVKSNVKSHLKIAQINKGNSNFRTKLNNILSLIEKEKPDILVVSEANMEENDPCIRNHLKGYNIEMKLLGELKEARMIVLIKSDITYEQIKNHENDKNAMITLKVKIQIEATFTSFVFTANGNCCMRTTNIQICLTSN